MFLAVVCVSRMDRRTLVTLIALLLMGAESDSMPNYTSLATPTPQLSPAPSTTPSPPFCHCLSPAPTSPPLSAPPTTPSSDALRVLTVAWDGGSCEGKVILSLLSSSSPVCHGSGVVREVLQGVCEQTRGCRGIAYWVESNKEEQGYNLTWQGNKKETSCRALMVRCTVLAERPMISEGSRELIGYKVVTGLLCFVLLAGIMIRFTKPTVRALQRRMSDRRQSRWIGPTHTHSVSYHRGKTAVQNDTDMSLSYPALERLAVSASREPSSNRNSDYDY